MIDDLVAACPPREFYRANPVADLYTGRPYHLAKAGWWGFGMRNVSPFEYRALRSHATRFGNDHWTLSHGGYSLEYGEAEIWVADEDKFAELARELNELPKRDIMMTSPIVWEIAKDELRTCRYNLMIARYDEDSIILNSEDDSRFFRFLLQN